MRGAGLGPGDGDWSQHVKTKSNNVRDFRVSSKRQARKAGKAPEVMAKVSGFSKGASHTKSNLDYISRNGEVPLEDERGQILKNREEVKEKANDWAAELAQTPRHKHQRDTMHLVLSMPEGTDPEAVRRATRNFARDTFKNHEYVFALHTDTKSPHTHLTVKMVGHDGKRLNPRKADLQEWRERFAEKMEQEGYMADATPRASRGVVKKPDRQVIRHIEKRTPSKIHALRIKEAASELIAEAQGKPTPPKPWTERIHKRQQEVRRKWLAAADRLDRGEDISATGLKENASVNRQSQRVRRNESVRGLRSDGGSNGPRSPGHANGREPGADNGKSRVDRGAGERSINAGGYRAAHRLAALYQSGSDEVERGRGAPPTNGLRNLSSLPMAQEQRQPSMLLHPDARSSLENGDGRKTDNGMRREGVRLDAVGGPNERLDGKDLARQIRQFVDSMPAIETRSEAEKAALAKQFTAPAAGKNHETTNSASISPGGPGAESAKSERDIER